MPKQDGNRVRDKHATISVITHKRNELPNIDEYLHNCEQQFTVKYLKRMDKPIEQAWQEVIKSLNVQLNNRGKNIVLECLQFGGNHEFWSGFPDKDEIRMYFINCYKYAIDKIGYLHTDKNIICALTVTEPNRRNLFVYYLPITEQWQSKVMSNVRSAKGSKLQLRDEFDTPIYTFHNDVYQPRLSHTEFWKQRGGLTSFSDLQEDFYKRISRQYNAKRGQSYSLIKNTNQQQQQRFNREPNDQYDELYFDDLPY
ncbi:MAG: plasmid recombination protein [Corallococcus sp.]|nr:plasmid recombination protein [Corallococcus sp.]